MTISSLTSYGQVAAAPGAVAIPTEWIQSGAVTPVAGSPAAQVSTGWVAQPSQAIDPQGISLLDAIAGALTGGVQQPVALAAMPAVVAPVATQFTYPMTVAVQAPVTRTLPAVVSMPAVVSAPAAGVSTQSALAGFASATGRVINGVAGAGASTATRVGTELWAGVANPRSVHVSQVPSKYNKTPAAGNKDCGPVSVVMALKLVGRSVPGVVGTAAPQKLVNRVRQLTGNTANTAATTNHELERALGASGATSREIASFAAVKASVLAGKPVILNGNPGNAGAYGSKFTSAQMTKYNGGHWIVVSGYDTKNGQFIINDPLSKVGPVKVSAAQLEAYRGGSMGIEVAA